MIDECQNLNFHELDSIITRIGEDSKIMCCGDATQTDLIKQNEKNGIHDFMKIIQQLPELFEMVEFDINDIVRSGLVREYLIRKMALNM